MDVFEKVKYLKQKNEFDRLCSYEFSILSHNSVCERTYSLINHWSDKRNRLDISTVNAKRSREFDNKRSTDFLKEIEDNKELLYIIILWTSAPQKFQEWFLVTT